jgi:hypothetical protein
MDKTLSVRLVRLPDLASFHDLERHPDFRRYGRFALLNDKTFWFSDVVQTSHPRDTLAGFYWAVVRNGAILVSARGAQTDLALLADEKLGLMNCLVDELKKRRIVAIRHKNRCS